MQPTISTLDLLQLASGDYLSLNIYKFIGKNPGKKAYLQANLHGSEIVGNAVIYGLIEFLKTLNTEQLAGEIWLVPLCNPVGVNQRNHFFSTGRFNSYDGKDWNRIFWDYEKECEDLEEFAKSQLDLEVDEIQKNYLEKIQKAFKKQSDQIQNPSSVSYTDKYQHLLQSLCLDANYVIDIHSSTNQGVNYLFCFQSRQESAKAFLLDYGILMNEYDGDAFDEAFMKPWLALEKQFYQLGKTIEFDVESWTLELGSGMKMNPESVQIGIQGIQNYLYSKEMLKIPEPSLRSRDIDLIEKSKIKKYYTPSGGMIQQRVALGHFVQAKDPLYQILSFDKRTHLPEVMTVCAEEAGMIFDLSTNEGVNQGEYVLSIMEGAREVTK